MRISIVAGLLFTATTYGQCYDIGRNVRITDIGAHHVEPHIAAHPVHAQNLIVSVTHVNQGKSVVETFSTSDAGGTWSRSELPGLRELVEMGDLEVAADTRVAYATDGSAYCALIAVLRPGHAWGRTPILLYRSAGYESPWKGPTSVGPSYDRPALVTSGGTLYVSAMAPGGRGTASVLLRSTDYGATLQRIASIVPDSLGHQPMQAVFSAAGTLVLPFVDFPRHREDMHASRVYVLRSRDAGTTFAPPVFVADIPRPSPGSLEMAAGRHALLIAFNGGPEGRRNLTVARSTDDGEAWTSKVISTDASFGSLAVAPNGTIGAGWIQHVRTRPECWEAYFSASTDNGQTFSAPVVISTAVSCPQTMAKTAAAGFKRGDNDYGDYIGLSVAADGSFHPVWIDARDGTLAVYTTRINIC